MSEIPEDDNAELIKELFIDLITFTGLIRLATIKGILDEEALNSFANAYLGLCIMLESTVFDDEDQDGYQSVKRYGAVVLSRLQGELDNFIELPEN